MHCVDFKRFSGDNFIAVVNSTELLSCFQKIPL